MKIPLYVIDAFTQRVFGGNPAAVCPLPFWIEDELLQSIARENNLSETAFFVARGDSHELRWFTPTIEMDLCGHATLAAAFVVLNYTGQASRDSAKVVFETRRSGTLTVERKGGDGLLSMDFPSWTPSPCTAPDALVRGLGRAPAVVLRSRDYLAVYDSEKEVRALVPDMRALLELDGLGIIATAPGDSADFVSRFFAPGAGVPEDPVTGSAHCTLTPYWAGRLGKQRLRAHQVSCRGGELICEHRGERVTISGYAVRYLEGVLEVNQE